MPIEDDLQMPNAATEVRRGATPPSHWLVGPAAYTPQTPWTPFWGLMAAVAIFGGSFVAVVCAVGVAALASGQSFVDVTESAFVKIAVTLFQQATMIALTVYAATRYGGTGKSVLALRAPAQGARAYPIAFIVLAVLSIVVSLLAQQFDHSSAKLDSELYLDMLRSPWWWLTFILVGVGAPLSEELLFRGFLFSALANSRLGLGGAAVISSLTFAAVHSYSISGVVQVFFVGLVLAWILIRTGSLRVTMVCHAIYNTLLATLLMFNIVV